MYFFTIDVEEWFHTNYDGTAQADFDSAGTRLEENVDRLIDACAAAGVTTTCFVLGSVAKSKPQVIRKLADAGHEIASHGYSHRSVNTMSPRAFDADLAEANYVLEDAAGAAIAGYRAPSFSVDEATLPWFYPALEAHGFRYSSSIFPGRTFLYGIQGFPPEIHHPEIGGRRTDILEIPVNRLSFAGRDVGLYLRLFSVGMIERIMRRQNARGQHSVLYVHPREIEVGQPRLELPRLASWIHYWGIRGCERKIRRILARNAAGFARMGDVAEAFTAVGR